MQVWSDEEVKILKDHFPKEGNKVSRRLPGKNRIEINKMTKELGLKWNESRDYNSWTSDEEEILKTYYPIEGKAVSKRLPRHTSNSVVTMAQTCNLKYRNDYWTEEEDSIIKNDYYSIGSNITEKLPNRSWTAIQKRAKTLGAESGSWGAASRWTEDEDIILRRYYVVEGKKVAERLPGRTVPAIKKRAMLLGLTRKKIL